ncbi:Protein of unknown function DUF3468 [Penicillium coprophilum]|uniref:Protein of unknown function DUF3468 n=1 Tax=Penicillium coprophilum TaxID=36646 RepID=UPI00239BA220|nr:Protein of unknown function DUF3468 [Penicillium coprophilum]KAJ5159274.1 Protein of unknown function DUF3468 [Penicillium coprophilum]
MQRTRQWRDVEARDSTNGQNSVALEIRAGRTELTWDERWYLDFYRNVTAKRYSRYFQNTFWDGLVLQICEQHPAVRHAAIAIGAHYFQLEQVQGDCKQNQESFLTLYHSTKAITYLRESLAREIILQDSPSSIHKQVVLVTCVILTILSLFQGDLSTSRHHLVSGYRLFKEWDVRKDEGSTGLALRQLFAQIHVHWSISTYPELFADITEPFDDKYLAVRSRLGTPTFTGIDQMHLVERFVVVVGDVILDITPYGFDIGPASSIRRDAALALTKLRLWGRRLMAFLVEANSLAPDDCDALRLVELWSGIIDIKLAVATSKQPDEMSYDDYLGRFQHTTKMAQVLAGSGSNDVPLSPFVYRFSVLPSLLWSGAKCRDWRVRRDICSILQKWTGDDYWVSATTLALKRLISIESRGVKESDTIPEAARAEFVNMNVQSGDSKVELRYRRPWNTSHSKYNSDEWESDTMYY